MYRYNRRPLHSHHRPLKNRFAKGSAQMSYFCQSAFLAAAPLSLLFSILAMLSSNSCKRESEILARACGGGGGFFFVGAGLLLLTTLSAIAGSFLAAGGVSFFCSDGFGRRGLCFSNLCLWGFLLFHWSWGDNFWRRS